MDSYSKSQLRRLVRSEEFDLGELFDEIKRTIQSRLQSSDSPEQAFRLKQQLDATDDLRLSLQRIADEAPDV